MTDNTLEPEAQTFSGLQKLSKTQKKRPGAVVLYHPDLSRIGAMMNPDALHGGEWVEVGRLAPDFVAPTSNITGGALDDPYISRQQLRLRWVEGQNSFEIQPDGRRPVFLVELDAERSEPKYSEIKEPTQAEPGALLAIGNRILLGLSLEVWNDTDEDRLGMVGETGKTWQLRRELTQVAQFHKPALVLGPTGSGKELVARALHKLSDRASGPFLPINCAALPEHLTESLLFGHKKGAFTGADTNRNGAFVEAKGGSLFMDEIGELPLPVQAKLLRVLQEGVVTPVGSNRSTPVDVRLMAATHRDFKREMESGNLRADFYYRIAVHPIHLPSLQARCWDVPMLFVHFLSQNRENHPELSWLWEGLSTSQPTIPITFFIELMRHPWPGNIRELQNAVEQVSRYNLGGAPFTAPPSLFDKARTVHEGPHITGHSPAATLDPPMPVTPVPIVSSKAPPLNHAMQVKAANHLGIARKTLASLLPSSFEPQQSNEPFNDFASRVEEVLLDTLLGLFDEHAFNQVHIADQMHISRTTLVRLMKRFGIPRSIDVDDDLLGKLRAGGDVEAIAEGMGISPKALRLFLSHAG